MNYKIIIAFDVSKKNIGVAVGNNLTYTVTPLSPISNYHNKQLCFYQIQNLISKWKPNKFIIGLPLNMDGTIQPTTKLVYKFAKYIYINFLIQTEMYDERLTTYIAKKIAINNQSKISIDSIAASIILEDWLNTNKYNL